MTAEPATYQLFRAAKRSAMHLETRDSYTPNDPDWNEWKAGGRFNPAERWSDWFDLMRDTTGRGIEVRRARIVSEPISDYIQFEYDVTAGHNLASGELVRWLPRHLSSGLTVPPTDYWVFDEEIVVWNHFDGNGDWVGEERVDDPELAKLCAAAFDSVWDRGTPHAEYRPG